LEAPLPCVVGVTGSINQPRFAPVKGKLVARNKPLDLIGLSGLDLAADLAGAQGSGTRVLALKEPPSRAPAQVVKDADDMAAEIYEFLRSRSLVP
jgi:electron transfer flavoprotein beta subunit